MGMGGGHPWMHPCHAPPENIKAMSAAPGGAPISPAPSRARGNKYLSPHPPLTDPRARLHPPTCQRNSAPRRPHPLLAPSSEITQPNTRLDAPPPLIAEKIFSSPLLAPQRFPLSLSARPPPRNPPPPSPRRRRRFFAAGAPD